MSSPAQCAYCFECLSASLEKRSALSLQQTEELWAKYNTLDAEQETDSNDGEEEDEEMEDAPNDNRQTQEEFVKPASISRLLAPSPQSSSSSSLPSTNSSVTTANSSATSTTPQSSSSRSSFFSLGRRLRRQDKPEPSSTAKYPLFVTWNTVSRSGNKSLRGCIGTFESQELDDGLRNYALTSAFDDARFMPISLRELSTLECGVTLLTDFETAAGSMAWDLGIHGLRISFTWHNRRYGATYLPDVPKEQGWSKEETLVSLMRKAGWSGRREEWQSVGDLQVVRYQGKRANLGYREWREWRDWVDEQGAVDGSVASATMSPLQV